MSDTFDYEPIPILQEELPDYLNLKCKYCGKAGFHWEKNKLGKYYLATVKGTKHTCRESCGFTKIPKEKKSGSKK